MAQLAIKGHATRGEKVIEILEMLGGKNDNLCYGGFINRIYLINENGYIESCDRMHHLDYLQLTLEEFLERFPYKVGDKVYYDNKICDVIEMLWNSSLNTISYGVYDGRIKNLVIVEELKPYKEEIMENKGTLVEIDLTREESKAEEIEVILGDYDFVLKDGKTYFVKKKPKYPKTYEECCKVLGIRSDWHLTLELDTPAAHDLIVTKEFDYVIKLASLRKLSICRDAYWKISGEQMGLSKPWEPDWSNDGIQKYAIFSDMGDIKCYTTYRRNAIFAFPTEEIRDAFYNNFKELIEECKEFL
jgi:hypothetical protein